MKDEGIQEHQDEIERLEKENADLRRENERLKAEAAKGRLLSTNIVQPPVINIVRARNTIGPMTGDARREPMLTSHGMAIPSPEEKAREISDRVKAEKAERKAAAKEKETR